MGCLTVIVEREGGIQAVPQRVGGIAASFARSGGILAGFTKMGGINVEAERRGGIAINLGLVCATNLDVFEVLWASDGPLLTIDNGYLITQK